MKTVLNHPVEQRVKVYIVNINIKYEVTSNCDLTKRKKEKKKVINAEDRTVVTSCFVKINQNIKLFFIE